MPKSNENNKITIKLVSALTHVLPYAENECESLADVERRDHEDVGHDKALQAIEQANAVIDEFNEIQRKKYATRRH